MNFKKKLGKVNCVDRLIAFKFERKVNGVRAAKVRRQGGVGQGKARRIMKEGQFKAGQGSARQGGAVQEGA